MTPKGLPKLAKRTPGSCKSRLEVGTPATVTQLVQLRDRPGRLWRATYLLQRQTGAGWRISGCMVAADSGESST
jgi:hypothetical protein